MPRTRRRLALHSTITALKADRPTLLPRNLPPLSRTRLNAHCTVKPPLVYLVGHRKWNNQRGKSKPPSLPDKVQPRLHNRHRMKSSRIALDQIQALTRGLAIDFSPRRGLEAISRA